MNNIFPLFYSLAAIVIMAPHTKPIIAFGLAAIMILFAIISLKK